MTPNKYYCVYIMTNIHNSVLYTGVNNDRWCNILSVKC